MEYPNKEERIAQLRAELAALKNEVHHTRSRHRQLILWDEIRNVAEQLAELTMEL